MTILATELGMRLRRQAELLITLITLATELAIPQQKNDYFFIAGAYSHRHKTRAISASKHY